MATLREKALRVNSLRSKKLSIQMPTEDGKTEAVEFLIRQPTVSQRNELISAVTDSYGNRNPNGAVKAVLLCVLDPETLKPVFEEADRDALLGAPAGGWVDTLQAAVFEMLDVGEKAVKN
jgi:hypothetical protein